MSKDCSTKSKLRNKPEYECNKETGRYVLKKGYKKQTAVGAPKRPMTAYFLFAKESHQDFKDAYPQATVVQLAKHKGAAWKEMSAEEKRPFVQRAEALKKQYGQKAETFKSTGHARTEIVEKPKVKRAANGYIIFGKDERLVIKREAPGLKGKEVIQELARRWNALSDSEKDQWRMKAKKLAGTL
jgi:hypothetical protein